MRILYLLLTPVLVVLLAFSASLLMKASTGMQRTESSLLFFFSLLGLPIVGYTSLRAWRKKPVDDRLPLAWLMATIATRSFLDYAKGKDGWNLAFGILLILAFLGVLIDRLRRPTLPAPDAPPEPEIAGPLRPSPETSSLGCLAVAGFFLLVLAMVAAVVLRR